MRMPLSTLSPAGSGQFDVGGDADADDDDVGGRSVPSASSTVPAVAGSAWPGRIAVTATLQRRSTPWSRVEVSEHPGQLGAEDREQRQLGVFEQGDLRVRRAGGGGGLQPDPAGADDHDPGARAGARP